MGIDASKNVRFCFSVWATVVLSAFAHSRVSPQCACLAMSAWFSSLWEYREYIIWSPHMNDVYGRK